MIKDFLPRTFFQVHPLECARALLGCELVWNGCGGLIVETESYAVFNDEACHTFSRPAARAFVEKNRAGTVYVYLNYGVHWLINVLVKGGPEDGIILIRALEPIRGIAEMEKRRGTNDPRALCSGPGKLTQALGITGADHERDFCSGKQIGFLPRRRPMEVVADTRIGIRRAAEFPWRFLEHESAFVSVKPGKGKAMPATRRKNKQGQTE
ncbi:MAG: 3mg [Chthoniobacteraceae bacterium]|nr:3mg [Chthoniobacteraceae bacterium]